MELTNPRSHHVPSVSLVIAGLLGVVALGFGVVSRSWWLIGLALALLIGIANTYISADRRHTRG